MDTDRTIPDETPYWETLRTTDPLAKSIFEALRARSRHERRHVLNALVAVGRRLETTSPREQIVRNSLALYTDATKVEPTATKYEKWRKAQDDLGLASASMVVRTYGSWNQGLEALGLKPKPDPTSIALLSRGRKISSDEALQALRDCSAALGTHGFSQREYRAWAIDELHRRNRQGAHLPIAKTLFERRFGSFRMAKQAAGLSPDVAYHSAGTYSDERLIEVLNHARSEIEGRLSGGSYMTWRRQKLEIAQAAGEDLQLPCSFTFGKRFGTWLTAVGTVEKVPVRTHEHGGPPVMEGDWIAEKLVEAYRELGEPFYIGTYREWRKEKLRTNPEYAPPDYYTVRRRMGAWPKVRELVRRASETDDLTELSEALEYRRTDNE